MLIPRGTRIHLAREPADFRKSIDGLSGVVRTVLKDDPDYQRCMALLEDPVALRKEIGRLLSRKQVALVVCWALNIDAAGTLAEIHDRIVEHPVVVFLLLAARFSARKRRAAIADVVRGVLTEEAQRDCCYETESGGIGEPDRLAALVRLYMDEPQNLRFVRALHLWHSSSAASLVLDDSTVGLLPRQPLDKFVLRNRRSRRRSPSPTSASRACSPGRTASG